jgi:hypothetical protein
LAGKKLGEVAGEFGVQITTLRTQLSSILRKTGVTRQVDLIRLLSHVPVIDSRRRFSHEAKCCSAASMPAPFAAPTRTLTMIEVRFAPDSPVERPVWSEPVSHGPNTLLAGKIQGISRNGASEEPKSARKRK